MLMKNHHNYIYLHSIHNPLQEKDTNTVKKIKDIMKCSSRKYYTSNEPADEGSSSTYITLLSEVNVNVTAVQTGI